MDATQVAELEEQNLSVQKVLKTCKQFVDIHWHLRPKSTWYLEKESLCVVSPVHRALLYHENS